MNRTTWQGPLALGLSLLLTTLPAWSADTPLGIFVPGAGTSSLNGVGLKVRSTLFSGDTVSTQAASGASVLLRGGDQVQLGPASAATLTLTEGGLLVKLESGLAVTRSGKGQQISVSTRGLLIEPTGTVTYQVTVAGNAVVVATHGGSVSVRGGDQSFVVPPDKGLRFVAAANAVPGRTGAGAQNLNEGLVWLVIIAAGAITGATFAVINHENAVVSPSTP